MGTTLDIIIVNWNAGTQLRECLASVAAARKLRFALGKVVVVDNASSDRSLEGLEEVPLPLKILRNEDNRGFASACNQGAAICDSTYFLFLNPDVVLHEYSLEVPITFMENAANSHIGICGIQLLNDKGEVTRTCARFPTLARFISKSVGLDRCPGLHGSGIHMTDWNHDSEQLVDHVIGAFYFVRRLTFESLRGFDERFFVYYEDLDFSFRAKMRGWTAVYLSDVRAFHAGGGTSRNVKSTRLFYSLRSRVLYSLKHLPRLQAWLAVGFIMIVEPIARLVLYAVKRQGSTPSDTLRGFARLVREWKSLSGEASRREITAG